MRKYADNETLEAWPSRATLAKDLGVQSIRTVDSAIKELVDLGALRVEKRYKANNEQTSNLYILISVRGAENCMVGGAKNDTRGGQELHPNYNHITKTNGDKPDGLQVKNLMAKFFENFTGELEPSRGQIAGQLQQALKQIPYEKLEPLVIQVALDGQVITRNTLIFAQNRLTEKPKQVTPMRPKFDPAEFENPDAKPMPNNFRDMVKMASDRDLRQE